MSQTTKAGDLLAGRYRLRDLLTESREGRFWTAFDEVLRRKVAVHIIPPGDERCALLINAARDGAIFSDRRILSVLDADSRDQSCYVVNEWGEGTSLDIMLETDGVLAPRRAAWLTAEVAEVIAKAHELGLTHGRLVPENVMIDINGQVRIIGFGVDAALHGLPPGRPSDEVTDLAAILHAALTGTWAGKSESRVPSARRSAGRVLRPRQIKPGIPRPLDALCDMSFNGTHRRGDLDVTSARGLATALEEFLGHVHDTDQYATGSIPVIGGAAGVEGEHHEHPEQMDVEQPTEAGMPVFHDDADEVEWLRARANQPTPPPPFEEPPDRPLFAPEPKDGEPLRRPRAGTAAAEAHSGEYWPWYAEEPSSFPSSPSSSGSYGSGVIPPYDTGEHSVPGRSWIRVAMVIGLAAMMLIAAVIAYQLGLGPGQQPDNTETTPTPTPTATPTPLADLSAKDFDPQSDDGLEYPDLVPLAVDGNAATAWRTSTYKQNLGPGGLKTGVGLTVDVGEATDIHKIAISTAGGPTSLEVYVTGKPPTSVDGRTAAGKASGTGLLTVDLPEPMGGRYVTIWLTSLPQLRDGFRGVINEVVVYG